MGNATTIIDNPYTIVSQASSGGPSQDPPVIIEQPITPTGELPTLPTQTLTSAFTNIQVLHFLYFVHLLN
ncbi:hypothetical protein HYC85_017207 [Camellia sinensis]|uniref:Uncharacterized protein n=1 Tax=Camellia sinensis TaxID=4442 RepID=A0A7J7H1W6_CAMSI|nr:hypothetical protein HYC85_017207 [Camellia sinensis]